MDVGGDDGPVDRRPAGTEADAILDGVERGEEDIFPDPMSASMAESWRGGAAKELERENAALVTAEPVGS